jgi:hypothetical protein
MTVRKLRRAALVALGGAWLLSAAPLAAHHAFSTEFDAKQPITLKGMIEAGSPNTLVRRGMTRDSIPAGTEVVVFGYRHRNGSNAANGRDVTLPDGRRLFITSPGTGAPASE